MTLWVGKKKNPYGAACTVPTSLELSRDTSKYENSAFWGCLTQTSMSDLEHRLVGLACSDHQEFGKCGETGLHRGFRGAQHCDGWWRASSLHPARRTKHRANTGHVAGGQNRTMHPRHMMAAADFGRTWLPREIRSKGRGQSS